MALKKFTPLDSHKKLKVQMLMIQMLMHRPEQVSFLAAYFRLTERSVGRYLAVFRKMGVVVDKKGKGIYQITKCPFCECTKNML